MLWSEVANNFWTIRDKTVNSFFAAYEYLPKSRQKYSLKQVK